MKNSINLFGLVLISILSSSGALASESSFERVDRSVLQRAMRLQLGTQWVHPVRFDHNWFQYSPSRLLVEMMDGKNVDYYDLEFYVIQPIDRHILAKVKCLVEDYVDEGHFLIQECETRSASGELLTASERASLPRQVRRLGSHFFWMMTYDLVDLD